MTDLSRPHARERWPIIIAVEIVVAVVVFSLTISMRREFISRHIVVALARARDT